MAPMSARGAAEAVDPEFSPISTAPPTQLDIEQEAPVDHKLFRHVRKTQRAKTLVEYFDNRVIGIYGIARPYHCVAEPVGCYGKLHRHADPIAIINRRAVGILGLLVFDQR